MSHTITSELQACIEHCTRCHDICLNTATTHCLELGGKHTERDHYTLMLDCADICHTAADFMLRESPRHVAVCGVCAQICEACAEDCERIGDMDDCAEACRTCARSCREMASSGRR